MYDLSTDPFEVHNLASLPEHQGMLCQMRRVLDNWRKDTGDMGEIPETELAQRMWPGGIQPQTAAPVISPPGGTLGRSARVTITCSTEGASIAYTVQPEPEAHWQLYTKPIELRPPVRLRARAIRYGFKESTETVATFDVGGSRP